jgi:hypothetical protein
MWCTVRIFICRNLCIGDDDVDDDNDDDDCHGGLSALLIVEEAKVKHYSSRNIIMN